MAVASAAVRAEDHHEPEALALEQSVEVLGRDEVLEGERFADGRSEPDRSDAHASMDHRGALLGMAGIAGGAGGSHVEDFPAVSNADVRIAVVLRTRRAFEESGRIDAVGGHHVEGRDLVLVLLVGIGHEGLCETVFLAQSHGQKVELLQLRVERAEALEPRRHFR